MQTDALNPPPALDTDSIPIPPRFWWLKRILIASGGLLVALVVLRFWWGWYADRQLQAEIDRIIAAGEPIYPEDFDPKEQIPDDQNAAKLIEQATNLLVTQTSSGVYFDTFLNKPELFETDQAGAEEIMEKNAAVRALLRLSRGKPVTIPWRAKGAFSQQRLLSKYLFFSAVYFHGRGDDAEAVESLHDIYWQAHVVKSEPKLIAIMVGDAIEGLGKGFVEPHGAQLEIEKSGEASTLIHRGASRDQVLAIVRHLLDDTTWQEEVTAVYQGERTEAVEYLKTLDLTAWPGNAAVTVWDSYAYHPLRPMYVFDTIRKMQSDEFAIKAANDGRYQHFAKRVLNQPDVSFLEQFSRPLTQPFGPDRDLSSTTVSMYFRSLAERRMTALALAIRLYEVDHGKRPDSLADLVPVYVANIPDDPFAMGDKKIAYHRDVGKLYSVWVDGIDNSGAPRTGRKPDGTWDNKRADLVFYLDGRPEY